MDIEHLVATHIHARQLRAAGLSMWPHKINLQAILDSAKDQESPAVIVSVAHRVATELRKLPARFFELGHPAHDEDFTNALEELEQMTVKTLELDMENRSQSATDVLDEWLEEIYNGCDRKRVWTRG